MGSLTFKKLIAASGHMLEPPFQINFSWFIEVRNLVAKKLYLVPYPWVYWLSQFLRFLELDFVLILIPCERKLIS